MEAIKELKSLFPEFLCGKELFNSEIKGLKPVLKHVIVSDNNSIQGG